MDTVQSFIPPFPSLLPFLPHFLPQGLQAGAVKVGEALVDLHQSGIYGRVRGALSSAAAAAAAAAGGGGGGRIDSGGEEGKKCAAGTRKGGMGEEEVVMDWGGVGGKGLEGEGWEEALPLR